MKLMKKSEILAPAGNPQALEAALACGANAVYLGVGTLNARRNAENFTEENLADTVRRCHIAGTKIYLTLNTVLQESETKELLRVAGYACSAGVDAVIVQDLGVAAILRKCAPDLRLHASTQMAVHNAEGAVVLKELGFSRVVLARECSCAEIAKIVKKTTLEVEVFVHGALCMCVSGQCYMSSVLGQRSGNRGLCAQPCRLPFKRSGSEYALSLKDMSLVEKLVELSEIGVTSFKIEGRMKRPEYVAAAVTACREALSGGTPDLESLRCVFSRSGFTDGYFMGKISADMFGVRLKEDVTAATSVLGKLANLYNEPKRHIRNVDCSFDFTMRDGEKSTLTVTDCDGNTVDVFGDIPQKALNKPTDEERVISALSKTGGTPYKADKISCKIDDGLMLPAAAINSLRRDALSILDEKRGAVCEVNFDKDNALVFIRDTRRLEKTTEETGTPSIRVRLYSVTQLTKIIAEKADLIILPLEELIGLCSKGVPSYVNKLCVGIPRILFSGGEKLREELKKVREIGISHASAGNIGALEFAREAGFPYIHGEAFMNCMNSTSMSELKKLGFCDATLSFELGLEATKALPHEMPRGLTVYGRIPLMTFRACPIKVSSGCAKCKAGDNYIVDRKDEKLYLSCAYACAELMNPVPLYMADRLTELNGLDFVELRFSTESEVECEKLFTEHLIGGVCDEKFTRGLLYKTIL